MRPLSLLMVSMALACVLYKNDGLQANPSTYPSEEIEALKPEYDKHKLVALEATLDYMHSLFLTKYAPIRWKQRHLGWNARTQIQQTKNQLYQLNHFDLDSLKPSFNRLIDSLQDGHSSLTYEDKRAAMLPLAIAKIGNKIIVTYSGIGGIEPGDELLRIDGKPVLEYASEALYGSSASLAPIHAPMRKFWRIFCRVGEIDSLPNLHNPLELSVNRGGFFELTLQINWTYIANVDWFFGGNNDDDVQDLSDDPKLVTAFAKSMRRFVHEDPELKKRRLFEKIAKKESSKAPIRSYTKAFTEIYQVNGRSIGYFRLPDFRKEKNVEVLDEAIERLNETTEALLIDLRDNGGGYDYLCYALLSRLTDKPLINFTESTILDQSTIDELRSLAHQYEKALETCNQENVQELFGKTVLGYTITYDLIKNLILHYRTQIEEWEQGQTCTRFIPSSGMTYIEPHPGLVYTKPIFLLTNECSGSCGDLFPAILKDNHRATLIGRTTAGLGGHLHTYEFPNFLGIKQLSLTKSLALRNNQCIIENLGVAPHHELPITEELAVYPYLEIRHALFFIDSQLENPQPMPAD